MDMKFNDSGHALVPNVLNESDRQRLIEVLGTVSGAGRRGLLDEPLVAQLARSQTILNLVRPHLPAEPLPVRAIYFDKSPDANWLVAWHQDLTIAVRERVEAAGFGPWSMKGGVPHVQPPMEMLERMITVRLHLDDADAGNGALRVLPGSHRFGRLSAEKIQELRATEPEALCVANAGDVLLMRPLILHASGRSNSPKHRRILHIEYAGFDLPPGLQWQET